MSQQTEVVSWRGATTPSVPAAGRDRSAGKSRPAASRSKSQPKQRGKSKQTARSTSVTASSAAASAKTIPTASSYEVKVAKARKAAEGKSPEELETRLQELLRGAHFADAAYLIAASAHLGARFQTSDVVRLMLEAQPHAFEHTAQLLRDLKLQNNEQLVTLFVNELVRGGQFHASMRIAQEMVPGFAQPSEQQPASTAAASRPSWTPQALIQAMIRARRFRVALKFAKQFDLLAVFPAPQLVANMLELRQWEEAVSSVMEYKLWAEFPLEALTVKMLQERQWSQAVKCIAKLPTKEMVPKFQEAFVREAAHVGHFVTAILYLREFKLDAMADKTTRRALLQFLVDAMLAHGEFYKAIKYAMKFSLAKNPLDELAATMAAEKGLPVPQAPVVEHEYLPQYSVETLIRKAMESGQFHVAITYIKKLRLRDAFAKELVDMEQAQQSRLHEFRRYTQVRAMQFQDPTFQETLDVLLGPQAQDEMVELYPLGAEMVLSEVEEVVPRKKKEVKQQEDKQETREDEGETGNAASAIMQPPVASEESSAQSTGQSRFGFARAALPPPPPPGMSARENTTSDEDQTHRRSVPPARSASPPGLFSPSDGKTEQQGVASSAGGFNFAEFANSVQISEPSSSSSVSARMPPPPRDQQRVPAPQPPFLHQQQGQNMFSRSMPPMPNGHFTGGPPGYPAPPMPQQNPMYFPRGGLLPPGPVPPNQQQRGYAPPPPPPPPQPSTTGGSFDVASLAMQFHSAGGTNGGSSFAGGFGAPPRLPMGYPPHSPPTSTGPPHVPHLFPGLPPPPPGPYGAPPPPPRSSFKPSMAYTSVITTRQKK